MSARPTARSPLRRLLLPALTAVYLGYFGFHAFNGSYGLLAKAEIEAEADRLALELAEVQAERAELDARAALLRPGGIDPDLVDELARRDLNVIAPNEVVIIP
jgi:cell division protein FtsB